jgi:hypothetical protein
MMICFGSLGSIYNLLTLMLTGTANNAGAILVLGRDLVVVPKLIHPLPPAITSPEASPDHIEDTWMQVSTNSRVIPSPNNFVLQSTS